MFLQSIVTWRYDYVEVTMLEALLGALADGVAVAGLCSTAREISAHEPPPSSFFVRRRGMVAEGFHDRSLGEPDRCHGDASADAGVKRPAKW